MPDPAALARRAQEALVNPSDAVLLIQGGTEPARRTSAVILHEDSGQPRLVCDPTSPVRSAAQANRSAILTVPGVSHSTVRFTGDLEVHAIETVDGYPNYVVGMRLRSVFVDAHRVPLDVYLDAAADVLSQYAARLRGHANACHGTQLRALVADWCGVEESEIAAAQLAWVDTHGALIEWVDAAGAHTRELEFPRAAATAGELSLALQAQLRR